MIRKSQKCAATQKASEAKYNHAKLDSAATDLLKAKNTLEKLSAHCSTKTMQKSVQSCVKTAEVLRGKIKKYQDVLNKIVADASAAKKAAAKPAKAASPVREANANLKPDLRDKLFESFASGQTVALSDLAQYTVNRPRLYYRSLSLEDYLDLLNSRKYKFELRKMYGLQKVLKNNAELSYMAYIPSTDSLLLFDGKPTLAAELKFTDGFEEKRKFYSYEQHMSNDLLYRDLHEFTTFTFRKVERIEDVTNERLIPLNNNKDPIWDRFSMY